METICKLCGKSGRLINSHIVPEFMYNPMFDASDNWFVEAGRFQTVGKKRQLFTYQITKGATEHLFCRDCDNQILGRLDDKAAPIINEIRRLSLDDDYAYLIVEYTHFKLFLLSLLFRAAISSHYMFKNVRMNEDRVNQLRLMILSDNPGKYDDFACIVRVSTHPILRKLMIHSQSKQEAEYFRCLIITPGIHFDYYLKMESDDFPYDPLFMRENGLLPIIKNGEQYDKKTLEFLAELIHANDS